MDAITLGPVFIPLERLIFALAMTVVLLVGYWLERRHGLVANKGLWVALGAGFAVARVVHVAEHWAAYQPAPLESLYLWQGGFNFWAGIVAALGAGIAWSQWNSRSVAVVLAPVTAGAGTWLALSLALPLWQSPPERTLPSVLISDLNGAATSLADMGGQPMIVNIWATWCGPCRREMPLFQRTEQAWPNVRFVYVNQGEDAGTVTRFLRKEELTLGAVMLDQTGSLLARFESRGLPTTVFFDASGRQVAQHAGEISAGRLREYLRELTR